MPSISGGSTTSSDLDRALRLHTRGELEAAALVYVELLRSAPGDARVLTQLGLVRMQQGRLGEALELLDRAIAAETRSAAAHAWRGEVLRRQGTLEAAIDAFRAALVLNSDFAPAYFNLALAEVDLDNPAAARAAWRRFSELRPADPRVSAELGMLAYQAGDFNDAVACFTRQFEKVSDDANAAFMTGMALERMARLPEAIQWFAKAEALAPRRAAIRSAAGVAHFNLGNLPQALGEYDAALELDPGFSEARSNRLIALHHALPHDAERLMRETIAWTARHANVASMSRAAFANDRDPRRRLKVGYVSPRFCGGPLAHFFLPLLEAHDREAVQVTCYALSPTVDEATIAMRTHADAWRDAQSLDDDALVEMIRGDGIDILVDLVGHCPGQRLAVFARRGAPVQFTWMDYVGTTGLATMDYIVTDPLHTPLDTAQRYTERVVRMPRTRLCYRPTPPLPELADSPSLRRGPITFGCFNRLNKIGPAVIAAWSRVLSRVPGSRLLLRATAFAAESTRALVRQRFADCGVEVARIDLRPFAAESQMMLDYREIDVVLDPFPYNGCTTTCDALSMGVPVVTIEGESLAGRHGVALLTVCGLESWVARTIDEYVELAVRAAHAGHSSLAARKALRKRFLASPLCDGPRFTRAFEDLYRDAWREWCQSVR